MNDDYYTLETGMKVSVRMQDDQQCQSGCNALVVVLQLLQRPALTLYFVLGRSYGIWTALVSLSRMKSLELEMPPCPTSSPAFPCLYPWYLTRHVNTFLQSCCGSIKKTQK